MQVKNAMFEYGRHLGLAFQVVDDILDFTQTSEQLGKPQVRRRSLNFLHCACALLHGQTRCAPWLERVAKSAAAWARRGRTWRRVT